MIKKAKGGVCGKDEQTGSQQKRKKEDRGRNTGRAHRSSGGFRGRRVKGGNICVH